MHTYFGTIVLKLPATFLIFAHPNKTKKWKLPIKHAPENPSMEIEILSYILETK